MHVAVSSELFLQLWYEALQRQVLFLQLLTAVSVCHQGVQQSAVGLQQLGDGLLHVLQVRPARGQLLVHVLAHVLQVRYCKEGDQY